MNITFAGVALTFAGTTGRPFGIRVNGAQAVQAVQLSRALEALFIDRGNGGTTFEFSVRRLFSTRSEAEFFALTHKAQTPTGGRLYVNTGSRAAELTGAVLVGVACGDEGLSVPVTYQFQGGLFQEAAVVVDAETVFYANSPLTVKKNRYALASGASSQAITFASAFAGDPEVYVELIPPTGQPIIGRALRGAASTTGFTVDFATALPASGYVLSWIAFN